MRGLSSGRTGGGGGEGGADGGGRRRADSLRLPSQTTVAAKVSPPAIVAPTTRANSPAVLVDPDRFDTSRTTNAIGTVAMTTRVRGAHVTVGARRPNHWWKTARASSAATV